MQSPWQHGAPAPAPPHPPTSSSPTAHAPRHFAQFAVLRQHTRGQISLSLFLLLHEPFHPTSADRSSSHSALSGGVEEGGGEGWGWSGGVCFPFLPLTDSLPRSAVTLWLSFSLPPPQTHRRHQIDSRGSTDSQGKDLLFLFILEK